MFLRTFPARSFLLRASFSVLMGAGASLAWAHGAAPHGASAASSMSAGAPAQTEWGVAGRAPRVTRTVALRLDDDMRFHPDRLVVREGETVKFVIRNAGRVMHEFVLGTPAAIDAHAQVMKKNPTMAHDSPYMAHVAPGERQTLIWTFNRPGEFVFACLLPGHFEAGMRGTVVVKPAPRTRTSS